MSNDDFTGPLGSTKRSIETEILPELERQIGRYPLGYKREIFETSASLTGDGSRDAERAVELAVKYNQQPCCGDVILKTLSRIRQSFGAPREARKHLVRLIAVLLRALQDLDGRLCHENHRE